MKKVLVIRKFDSFSRVLTANNFEIINLPLIETKALEDLGDFETKLEQIEKYDGVFLTSRHAAEIFRAKLAEKALMFRGKVYVLGRRGYEILKAENLNLFFDESANTVREMLKKIAPEDVKNKNFLFVRGKKSLRTVPEFLAKKAFVDEAIVYETLEIAVNIEDLKVLHEKFEKGEITTACFFSPSGAESFIKQFGTKILHQTVIAAIGKTTAAYFAERKFKVGFVASKATAEDFAVELVECLERNLAIDFHR